MVPSLAIDSTRRSVDPTGTKKLRKAFRASADMQLRQLRAGLRQAIVDFNVLGLSGPSNYTFMAPAARLQQFAGWIENAAYATLDARWWAYPWLERATQHGLEAARREMGGDLYLPVPTTFESLHQLAHSELRGIIGAMVQKMMRQAHSATKRRLVPHMAFRELVKPIDGDIRTRLQLFAHGMTIKGHVHGKVAYYRSKGVTHAGINPELRLPKKKLVKDSDEEEVSWVTADDELVCDDCQDMADGGPYTLDEVEDLIPLHANCRCDITIFDGQYGDSAFFDSFDPGEERDEHGRWGSGGVTSTPQFKYWFKGSKVVDKDGKPLVAYHGSTKSFSQFNTINNKTVKNPNWLGGLGSWFSAPSQTSGDPEYVENAQYVAQSFTEKSINDPSFDWENEYKTGATVYPVYLAIKNPYDGGDQEMMVEDVHSAGGQKQFREQLIKQGHDGIILYSSSTDGNVYRDDWIAFHPEQIKSAIGNKGAFDPSKPDIRDAVTRAAGVIFVDPDGAMLFTRRSDTGQWSIPAGGIESGETPEEAASREAAEEIGKPGDFTLEEMDHRTTDGVDFYTFVQRVDSRFDPILNGEHTEFIWDVPDEAPQPLHPGLLKTLLRLSP